MKINPDDHQYAIGCHSDYGPTFVEGICVKNNANATMEGCSYLGSSYKHPQYAYGTDEAETFLAGSHEFQLAEIEVYQKE